MITGSKQPPQLCVRGLTVHSSDQFVEVSTTPADTRETSAESSSARVVQPDEFDHKLPTSTKRKRAFRVPCMQRSTSLLNHNACTACCPLSWGAHECSPSRRKYLKRLPYELTERAYSMMKPPTNSSLKYSLCAQLFITSRVAGATALCVLSPVGHACSLPSP